MGDWTALFQRFPARLAVPEPEGFQLGCRFDTPASDEEIREAWGDRPLPADLIQLWRHSRQCWLFEDLDYGQWGLHLLTPSDSYSRTEFERVERKADYLADDVVVGEFLGDQDLLVVSPLDPRGCELLVSLPLDPRAGWYVPSDHLGAFLEQLLKHGGAKFWEPSG